MSHGQGMLSFALDLYGEISFLHFDHLMWETYLWEISEIGTKFQKHVSNIGIIWKILIK